MEKYTSELQAEGAVVIQNLQKVNQKRTNNKLSPPHLLTPQLVDIRLVDTIDLV